MNENISKIAFGAGPVSQLFVGGDPDVQRRTIAKAIDVGINWFDTAATYGDGISEANLGARLAELGAANKVHVATKVRVMPSQLTAIRRAVRNSVTQSLRRLGLERVTLLQIHNSITHQAGSQPTSITPAHVLAPGGLLEEMQLLQAEGLVTYLGLTGLGDASAVREVLDSGAFAAIQVPYHLLNPSAGQDMGNDFPETNHGNLIDAAAERGLSTFAIRILAGGALAGRPPSPHTLKTPFFSIDLYQRDSKMAAQLRTLLPPGMRMEEAAVRFVLSHPQVTSAIIGFATPEQVEELARFATAGPHDPGLLARLNNGLSSLALGER